MSTALTSRGQVTIPKQIRDALGLALIEVPRPALFLAGKAFVRYCRQGGSKDNALAATVTTLPI